MFWPGSIYKFRASIQGCSSEHAEKAQWLVKQIKIPMYVYTYIVYIHNVCKFSSIYSAHPHTSTISFLKDECQPACVGKKDSFT